MNAPERKLHEAQAPQPSWSEMNRQWLATAMAELCARLEGRSGVAPVTHEGFTPALVHCARAFGLSPFEADLLLLVAGVELDHNLRSAVLALNGGRSSRASFALAFAHLTEPHWDALSPDAPLRRLCVLEPETAEHLVLSPLRINERVLHFVSGVAAKEPALHGVTSLLPPPAFGSDADWAAFAARTVASGAVVILDGGDRGVAARMECAQSVAFAGHRAALWVFSRLLPDDLGDLDRLARFISREARLTGILPAINAEEGGHENCAILAAGLECAFIWFGAPFANCGGRREYRLSYPTQTAQDARDMLRLAWQQRAPDALRDDENTLRALDRAAHQFQLSSAAREDVISRALVVGPEARFESIWATARAAARRDLDGLAQRIDTRITFDDLVMPPGPKAVIADIARHLRQRERVYRDWGFGAKHALGEGLVALFAGESGTGKTLAAEAIANEVKLDLYRVDLASLVSKWIGETEKNLKRLFDAAEASGAVLVFDEADALFGKRSEAKDSHDRYANIEVAYLLQRVEAYRGLAILTTNMKGSLDRAFLRRIRFVVNFPFPSEEARAEIWRKQFPPQAPVGEIDLAALARLAIPGGNIRSIALNAAFKAADAGKSIGQDLLMSAAREEFAKLERPFGDRGRMP